MFKLALSAGHYNGNTKGIPASLSPNNHPNEWTLNDRVADAIEKRLKQYDGVSVLRLDDTTGKVPIEIDERTDKANAWDADFYLAIHHNGGINGGTGGGIVAYVYTSPSAESVAWQKELYNALIAKTGLKGNRATPLARDDLHEVRETVMPAVLLELGFMDSKTDIKTILKADFADQCANAIVEVIAKRAKLKLKETKPKEQVFKKGETSLGIYAVKRLLWMAEKLDLVPAKLLDDGGFGDGTAKDVKAVQKATKLPETGTINEATIRALSELVYNTMDDAHRKALNDLTMARAENTALKADVERLEKALVEAKGGKTT